MMRAIAPLLAATMLTACAVGPGHVPPVPPAPATGQLVESDQTPSVTTAPAVDQWWRLFDDPALDRLVADALANNSDVRVAAANLRRARALLTEAGVGRLPSTDISAGYTRQRIGTGAAMAQSGGLSGGGTGTMPDSVTSDLFTAGLDASYEIDLFGRVTRQVEAARGDAAAAAARLDAARVSIAAETARAYAGACSYAAQTAVARETARLQGQTLDLTRRLLDAGRGSRRDVSQAETLAEQARAQVPGLEAERRAALYALATLTGRPPAEVDAAAAACTTPPRVTQAIPVGDGAALLKRRPDVAAAERQLAADTARIGVATAALFPQIRLLGSVSVGGNDIDQLGRSSSFGASIGPLISWSFPNVGVARARIRQARASAEASLASFDGTVLTALRETEQALARYAGEIERNGALRRAATASDDAAALSRLRFDSGADSFLQLLDAERSRASARATLAQSDAALAEAQVALFKALGGGWADAPPVVEKPLTPRD